MACRSILSICSSKRTRCLVACRSSFASFEFWNDAGIGLADEGYFSFGKVGRGGDEVETYANLKYGLTFDLNLGTLGSLGSKLKEFQLRLLLGWREFEGKTQLALGFKFDGAGGENLDIGIGNLFRLKAQYYGIDNVSNDANHAYVIYAWDAKLTIFGKEISDPSTKFSLFIFANPNDPGRVGWFVLMRRAGSTVNDIIDLSLLGGGQRVDPFDRNARSVGELIKNIPEDFRKFASNNETTRGPLEAPQAEHPCRYPHVLAHIAPLVTPGHPSGLSEDIHRGQIP